MIRNLLFLFMLLLACAYTGFAQHTCDLTLTPEGDNLCILEKHAYDFSMIRACRGNIVNYRANSPSAISYAWNVVGGDYQIFDNGKLCQVTWGDGYHGMVIVEALLPDSSVCTSRIQIVLENKPVASIISMPNYIVNVDNPEEKWIEVCAGDTISFVDNSTSADLPIIDYYWEFPYGVSNNRSISFVARDPGSFPIIHRVYNECGCYDEVVIKLIVKDECPLKLSCFGTACAYSQHSYSILSPGCSDYLWNVEGGTIVNSQHQPDVVVQWDAPESGFGMLYLDGSSCYCECKSRKSIKIPVISDNVNINGPDIICLDESYTFSVPLWGSTNYSWSVMPSTDVHISENNNNLILTPHRKRTYTISVTYSCDFLGCGPYTVTKVINVKSKLNINTNPSDKEVCVGSALAFSTNTTAPSNWTVELNNNIVHSISAPTLSYTFTTSGIFVIKASNTNYCNEAQTIVIVKDPPPAPTDISGPSIICPTFTAEYSAIPSRSGCYLLWEWNKDGTIHTYTGNKVNIAFGNTVEDINVYQIDRNTGCRSEASVYHVSPFQLAEWPYQNLIRVCQGQKITLSSLRNQSDDDVLYEWNVEPANALSIQGSHLNSKVTLLANHTDNLPTTVRLILKRTYCHTFRYDTAYVRIGEIAPPTITHSPICMGQDVSFSVANSNDADMDASYWYLDNDSSDPVYSIPADLFFGDTNPHTVHLHYVSKYGCEIDAYDIVSACPPLPNMHIEINGDTLSVVIDGDSSGYRYLWMTGNTTSSIVVPSTDNYQCVVTSPECGCTRTFSHGHSSSYGCVYIASAFSIVNHCDNIISIDQLTGSGLDYPTTVRMTQGRYSRRFTVEGPWERLLVPDTGAYSITVYWNDSDTCYNSTVRDSIGSAIKFQLLNDCSGHLIVNAQRSDGTQVHIIATVSDPQSGFNVGSGTGSNSVSIAIPDTGWYQVHLQFDLPDCYIKTPFHFDAPPTIQGINIGNTLCEKTAFTFSANAMGEKLTYKWNFDDGSWNYGNGIDHVFGNSRNHHITLSITDRNSCSADTTVSILVTDNYLENYRLENTFSPLCPGDSAVIKTRPSSNNIYSWDPCSQFSDHQAYVYEAGTYIVDITSINEQCRQQLELNVPYPNGPFASILCDSTYCFGDMAKLVGDVGNGYNYQWYIHSAHISDSSTAPNIDYHPIDTGFHQVILLVTDSNNCTSSDTAYFYVNPTPSAPVLQFCGNPCITAGPVELCSSSGIELLWSNGTKGSSALYFTDGSAGAYYIDLTTGCKSNGATIRIPEAPDFDGLLTGCYCIDDNSLPADLPLYSLRSSTTLPWEWNFFSSPISNGTIPPSPVMLPVPGVGEYNLVIPDYGSGCKAVSTNLSIESQGCKYQITSDGTPSVKGYVVKKDCELIDCKLRYRITVRICNETERTFCIDNVYPILPIHYSITSGLPIAVLSPGECQDITLVMQYDFSSPSSFVYVMTCGGNSVGAFVVNLSDWMDCVQPDTCVINVTPSFVLDQTLSQPNQSAFFNFVLTFPSTSGNVISVGCEQGQIIDGNYSGSTYSGLLMMDYGLMTQLVVDSTDFCFHIVYCDNDKICISTVCTPYKLFWEMCGLLENRSQSKGLNGARKELPVEEDKAFVLVPNPATDWVKVVKQKTPHANDEIRSIEVFSMNGQKVVKAEYTNQFDASRLSSGSYIVKVVTSTDRKEYIKLIKQ